MSMSANVLSHSRSSHVTLKNRAQGIKAPSAYKGYKFQQAPTQEVFCESSLFIVTVEILLIWRQLCRVA